MMTTKMIKTILLIFLSLIGYNLQGQSVTDIINSYENLDSDKDKEDHQHWPIYSQEEQDNENQKLSKILTQVKSAKTTSTAKDDLINLDLLELILEDRIYNIEFKKHELPLSAEGGFLTNIIFGFRNTKISDEKSGLDYIEKINSLPSFIDSKIDHLKAGQKRGVSSPKLIANLCLGMAKEVLETPIKDNFFYKNVEGTQIESKALQAIENQIIPSYKRLVKYLEEEYIPNAPKAIGISEISGGKAYYEQRVRYYATEDISPKEVFDIGMSEVQRIRKEMDEIISDLKFDGSFEEFTEFLRTDPQFYPKTPKELLHYAAWITKEMEGKLPDYFNKLPGMPLTVKPVPAAIAPNYTTGRYSPGSYKRKKAGQYWVNTTKLESRPLYVLPSLSLHEGVPGHHTQIMLAAELDLPEFRKNQYLSAFGEGWALYCEYLGKEAGMYHTKYEEFGALVYEMWRACRLVVDPGMHYMGWSREKAFQFMKDNTALSLHEVGTEINRYIGWPGQAISYKLGELKIRSLRAHAEDTLGAQFSIRDFHDKVLENGSIPMATLDRIVKNWVAEKKTKK